MLTLKDFLAKEVRPALGCTDPGAIALAVARACKELPERKRIASCKGNSKRQHIQKQYGGRYPETRVQGAT